MYYSTKKSDQHGAMDPRLRKRDWSDLPDDITRLILGKISFYPHYNKFAAACTDWYRITKEMHGPFQQSSVSLLLPYNHETDKSAFYQIHDSKTYELNLPELQGKYVYGYSNGWLVVGDNNLSLSLINLITHRQIELPEITIAEQFPHHGSADMQRLMDPFFRDLILSKLVISESPCSSNNCRVAAIFSIYQKLYVCQLGDKSWTDPLGARNSGKLMSACRASREVHCEFLQDVVFFQGKLYAINNGEDVVELDFDGPHYNVRSTFGPVKNFKDYHQFPSESKSGCPLVGLRVYLVECAGSLLVVEKLGELPEDCKSHKTCCFRLYKLEDKETWKRIHGLGENSLFLGQNGSISVSASKVPGCRPNCIYFADDVGLLQEKYDLGYGTNNGVYSCENDTVEMFNISYSVERWMSPAIWCQLKI